MTTFGKLLVFANLVFGVGAATWALAVYSQRPGWFEPVPEGGPRPGGPPSFASLAAEIDTLGKAAVSAGSAWTTQYNRLVQAEDVRAVRQAKMFGGTVGGAKVPGLLAVARAGGYPKAGDAAFFNLKDDPATKLLDLDPNPAEKGVVVLGPDGQPLRGADTLLAVFNAHAKRIAEAAAESTKLRAEQRKLGEAVADLETRVLKQREIRENVRTEAAYLAGLEVNTVGQLDWAKTRRDQLARRLAAFGRKD
ncbi:MAG: hypothetical protein K2X87_22740 [Gemmataceae bacterium]|nr:hypothetical protein [Gemmataceae bacterium]